MRIFSSWRSRLIALGALVGFAATAAVVATATFGPNRPTFTWAHPADHNTFNSITDNPVWGDERNLVKARDINAGTDTYTNQFQVKDNQEILVTTYFHNNAAVNFDKTAKDVTSKIVLPTNTGTTLDLTSNISSSNSDPTTVWATMEFTGSQPFSLEYETGSARLITNFVNMPLSDAVVNGGTLIGSKGTDGKVPGCSEFSGYVTIKVKVHVKPQVNPIYSCDMLNVKTGSDRKVDASVTYTAKDGATFSSAKFNWGDGTSPLVTSGTTGSHTYAKDGTYNIIATLTFNVGDTTATSSCSKSVTFTTPPITPPTTTVTPGKSLPNTGPGSVAAIFAGVSALAGAGHYFVTRKVRG